MDIDYSALFGAGFLLAIVIPILLTIVSLVILYLIIRAAVRGGLRDHQLWMERNRAAQRPSLVPGPVDGS